MTRVPAHGFSGQRREPISLARGKSIDLSPSDEAIGRSHYEVEIRSFADLQALDLIPRQLDEGRVHEAINIDDEEAFATARRLAGDAGGDCQCAEGQGGPRRGVTSYSQELRSIYATVRRRCNRQLAQVMTDAEGVLHRYDDIAPTITRYWVTMQWSTPLIVFNAWLFADVEIGVNATLALGKSAKGLYCEDLRIHTGGRLVIPGSSAKIRCASAAGNLP